MGHCEVNKKEICLDSSLKDPVLAKTELHEIIHALYEEYCIPVKSDEETVVNHLEQAFSCLMIDNPEYVRNLVSRLSVSPFDQVNL